MEQNQYFKNALAAFTADTAYVSAVRHLYDAGLSVEQIQKQLTFPATKEQIEHAIQDYEEEKKRPEAAYTYVQETNAYGRRSFRKVKKTETCEKQDREK